MFRTKDKLTEEQVSNLKKEFEVLQFEEDTMLFYENQIPQTGLVLIEGEIEVLKKSKVQKIIYPFTIIGINQIINNIPSLLGHRVRTKSRIMVLAKSEIKKLLQL